MIANDIWYRYIPSETGLLRLSTCRWSDFDTDVAVYRGSCQSLELVGCNDDAPGCPGGPSELLLPVRAGEALLVRLGGGIDEASGRGFLEVGLAQDGAFQTEAGTSDDEPVNRNRRSELHVPSQYATVQAAINVALDGDVIILTAGTYYENIVLLETDSDGDGATEPRNIALRAAAGSRATINGQSKGPVILATLTGGSVSLIDLDITGGSSINASTGGGLCLRPNAYLNNPAILISGCNFFGNSATRGSAIGSSESDTDANPFLLIKESTFTDNESQTGGTIQGQFNWTQMNDCVVADNIGHGISLRASKWDIVDGTEFLFSTTTLKSCSIENNSGAGLNLDDSGHSNNSPETWGAITTLYNCRIVGNGGGITSRHHIMRIVNCTIAYNWLPNSSAAGIAMNNGTAGLLIEMANTILWGNTNLSGRTAIAQMETSEGSAGNAFTNNIIEHAEDVRQLNDIPLVEDVNEDGLIDLSDFDNGGWMRCLDIDPMFTDAYGDDEVPGSGDNETHQLLTGSPGIDAGCAQLAFSNLGFLNGYIQYNWITFDPDNPAEVVAGDLNTSNAGVDIDGVEHTINDPLFSSDIALPLGTHPDIGCYEYEAPNSTGSRFIPWSNTYYSNNFWYRSDNWVVYPGDPAPDGNDTVCFTNPLLDNTNPSEPDSPNITYSTSVSQIYVGDGDWNPESPINTTLTVPGGVHIGRFGSADTPSTLTISDGLRLTTSHLLVDGLGGGELRLEDQYSSVSLQGNSGIELINGGSAYFDGSTYVFNGVVRNIDGVLTTSSATFSNADYTQQGSVIQPNGTVRTTAGTLVLTPGEFVNFTNGDLDLAGTVKVDFQGRAKRGEQYELLRFNGTLNNNAAIQPLGLPSNTFLKISRGTDLNGGGSLYGTVTEVSDVLALNDAPNSTANSGATDVKLADIDGDDDLDLAFTLSGDPDTSNGNLIVMLNQGDADSDGNWDGFELTASLTFEVGVKPSSLDIGDYEAGDGDTNDIVVANQTAGSEGDIGSVTLIRNLPTPTVTTLELSGEARPTDVCFFNLDQDTDLDIVVASEEDATLRLIENTGTRRNGRIPAEEETLEEPDSPPWGIEPGDEQAPKEAGLVVISRSANRGKQFKRGASRAIGLELVTTVATGTNPLDQASADLDLDGIDDHIVINNDGSSFSVFLRKDLDGDLFPELLGGATVDMSPLTDPVSIDLGDLDNDGDNDIAVIANDVDGNIVTRIWRNDIIYDGEQSEMLTFTNTGTDLESDGTPILIVVGEVDDVGGGGDQIGDDVVILSTGTTVRGVVTFVNPTTSAPVPISTVVEFEAAIAEAGDGDTILLAGGVFQLNERVDFTDRDFTIIGAVDDQGVPLTTIIASGVDRVFWMTGGQSDATRLENLIVEGGDVGGGIYMENTANPGPQLVNCIIRNCNWHDHGAGLRLNNAHATLAGCRLEACVAANRGGGAYVYNGGSMTADDCTFTSNQADDGGAFMIWDASTADLSNCFVELNAAVEYGGGAFVRIGAQLTCNNVLFRGNSNVNNGFYGGGITSFGGLVELSDCVLDDNVTTQSGGAIAAWNGGTLSLLGCELTGNTAASTSGGGLYSNGTVTVDIQDTTICDNEPWTITGPWNDLGGNCFTEFCDFDSDGTLDCVDGCPEDPNKTEPGECGCGVADDDADSDGTPDCNDQCPNDPNKTEPGECGCGNPETDSDGDGIPDCIDDPCPADLDDDHDVDVTDLLGLIGSWGPCDPEAPCPADFDGSGNVGVLDLLELIALWGECPGDHVFTGCTDEADFNEADYGCACPVDGDDGMTDCNPGLNGDGTFTPYELGDTICGQASVFDDIAGGTYRDTDWWDTDGMLDDGGVFSLEIGSGAAQLLGIVDLDAVAFSDYVVNEAGLYTPPTDVTLGPGTYCLWVGPSVFDTSWTCDSGHADYMFTVKD